MEVLDKDGLNYFWNKTKNYVNSKSNIIKSYTLDSDSSFLNIIDINIQKGEPFQILIDGTTIKIGEDFVNVVLYPNDKTTFDIARVAGFENVRGSINSIYNASTPSLYLGRLIPGSRFMIKGILNNENNFLKNISNYSVASINNDFVFGNLYSMISLTDDNITSLRIVINGAYFAAGTRFLVTKLT